MSQENKQLEELAKEMNMDTAFPIQEVLKLLIKATETLLHKKDYDVPDYEEMEHAVKSAKEINESLKAGFLAASSKGKEEDAVEFAEWLGRNYDFNEFNNKWGKYWEDEGNDGFNETPTLELYNIFKQSKETIG